MLSRDGHALATSPARSVQGLTVSSITCAMQGSAAWCARLCFPRGSRLAGAMLSFLQERIDSGRKPPTDYNFVMKQVAMEAEKCGLATSFLPTTVFGTIPYFFPSARLGVSGQRAGFVPQHSYPDECGDAEHSSWAGHVLGNDQGYWTLECASSQGDAGRFFLIP